MNNPCKECIVNSMCKKGCPLLIDYLADSLTYKFIPASLEFIATRIREGNISLISNNTKLTSNHTIQGHAPTKDYFLVKFSEMVGEL